MRKYLGYPILENKVMLFRKGNKKKTQEKVPSTKNLVETAPTKKTSTGKDKGKSSKIAPKLSRAAVVETKKRTKLLKKATSKVASKAVPDLLKGTNPEPAKTPTPESFSNENIAKPEEEIEAPEMPDEEIEASEIPDEEIEAPEMPLDTEQTNYKELDTSRGQSDKLLGDAIRVGFEDLGDNRHRIKTMAHRKHRIFDTRKASTEETSKRIKRANMSQHRRDMLDEAEAMYVDPNIPLLTQLASTGNVLPSRNAEDFPSVILHISESSESERSSHGEPMGDNISSEPIEPSRFQSFDVYLSEPLVGPDGNTSRIPHNISEEQLRVDMAPPPKSPQMVEVPPFHLGSSRVETSQVNPLNSPIGETSRWKLPIRSLRDGLLGCPLEALQALLPENYLQGSGAGKTSPERFTDILVHHQLQV